MIRQRQPSIPIRVEVRDSCAVAYFKGHKHKVYEDRFRMLTVSVPAVAARNAGQLYVVADGVGSAPMGANAAQHLCSRIDDFLRVLNPALIRCKVYCMRSTRKFLDGV